MAGSYSVDRLFHVYESFDFEIKRKKTKQNDLA